MASTDAVAGWKEKLDKALHEKNAFTDVLEKAEAKTGVRRLYLALALIALVGVYLMVGYGSQFLCNFIGFLYPAYASVKAIESRDKDDDTQWLIYWTVYSCFSLVEFFADIFLFWIPFYWFLKCIFLGWCMAPQQWNGSLLIYNKLLRPFVLKHQKKVDEALDKAKNIAGKALDEGKQTLTEAATDEVRRRAVEAAKAEAEKHN